MPEVTYYVALPFVASDDGFAPEEGGGMLHSKCCFDARRGTFAKGRVTLGQSRSAASVIPLLAISATPP
jgi:hypothetical protein